MTRIWGMFPARQVQGSYTPKAAIAISDDGALVRRRMFSGLSASHALDPKILQMIGKVNGKGKGNTLEIAVDDSVVIHASMSCGITRNWA